jgi:hypothetical protein
MKWSQLKKRIEDNFATSVHGRVEVWSTRYRHAHDQEGEAWITFDGQKVISLATYSYEVEAGQVRNALRKASGCLDYRNPEHQAGYYSAYSEADRIVNCHGFYPLWEFNKALFTYLNLSIDDALRSIDPLTKALGILDRRFGKWRLKDFDHAQESVLVKKMYAYRCICEGIIEPGSTPQIEGASHQVP